MPIERVVVNASPLITLFNSGLADLLGQLFTEVIVPRAVWDEIVAAGKDDLAARELPVTSWVSQRTVAYIEPAISAWDLGAGESEVLSFAFQQAGYHAVIDDAKARSCARSSSIPILGTGGIIVLAKRRGLVTSVAECLDKLQEAGLWLSDELVALLKRQANE